MGWVRLSHEVGRDSMLVIRVHEVRCEMVIEEYMSALMAANEDMDT